MQGGSCCQEVSSGVSHQSRDPFVSQSPSLAGLSTMAIIFDIGIRKHLTITVGCLSCYLLWGPLVGNPSLTLKGKGMSKCRPLSRAHWPARLCCLPGFVVEG